VRKRLKPSVGKREKQTGTILSRHGGRRKRGDREGAREKTARQKENNFGMKSKGGKMGNKEPRAITDKKTPKSGWETGVEKGRTIGRPRGKTEERRRKG